MVAEPVHILGPDPLLRWWRRSAGASRCGGRFRRNRAEPARPSVRPTDVNPAGSRDLHDRQQGEVSLRG